MINKYREKGKEYGLTNKADYLGVILLSSILPILLVYILSLLSNYFMFDIVVYDVGSLLISIGNCFIVYSILSIGSIISIPLAYFGKSMLDNTDETFRKRIVMSFKRLTVKNSIGIVTTTLITASPLLVMSVLFNVFALFEILTAGKLTFALAVLASSLYVLSVCIGLVSILTNIINYLLVPYLLCDAHQLSGKDARSKSIELMMGYRLTFVDLLIDFLFLGYSIFLILPIIYYIPYVYAATSYFAVERLTNNPQVVTEDSDSLILV